MGPESRCGRVSAACQDQWELFQCRFCSPFYQSYHSTDGFFQVCSQFSTALFDACRNDAILVSVLPDTDSGVFVTALQNFGSKNATACVVIGKAFDSDRHFFNALFNMIVVDNGGAGDQQSQAAGMVAKRRAPDSANGEELVRATDVCFNAAPLRTAGMLLLPLFLPLLLLML